MATATTAVAWTNVSDATFRGWGKWMSDQFAAFGWVNVYQLFGTGTNWTDVTAPAAISTVRVTEIWRMADTLQATKPLYLKITYGSGITSANNPGFNISFGTGHDGSGGLTGIIYTSLALTCTANANSMTHYASGSTGRIGFSMAMIGTGISTSGMFLMHIERRKDGSGADVGTGFLLATNAGGTTACVGATDTAPGPATMATWGAPLYFTAEANMTFGGLVAVAPLAYPMGPAEVGLGFVAIPTALASPGGTFAVTLLGSSHTYVACLQQSGIAVINIATGSASVRAAMRYE